MTWETVIGLEVHAQLKTRSKLFSGSGTTYGAPPNTQTSFIDAGLPGVLPALNQQAVHMAVQFGLAIDAEINDLSFFERKNYFYPDLPKGYQISQLQRSIVGHGTLEIILSTKERKKIHITRAQLEEDAGKSLHEAHLDYTGIDLNRAGIPLLEIITSPCLCSAEEVVCYLKTLHQLLRFLDICDGNMQEGSFRCDVNLSLKQEGSEQLGTRTELKNLNSFRFIEKAIAYEVQRHREVLETGRQIIQQTRLYCPNTDTTQVLRNKEDENDYRYFSDPDLLAVHIPPDDLARIKDHLPALPAQIRQRLQTEHKLLEEDIDFLLSSPALLQFYDEVKINSHAPAKTVINWLKGTYTAALNDQGINFSTPPVSADHLACLLNHLTDKTISNAMAKTIFSKLLTTDQGIDEIIAMEQSQQDSDNTQIDDLVSATISRYPQQVADYKAGKKKLLAFFVGQIMKETKGQADPEEVNALFRKHFGC